jgi:hypothetical protein
MLGPEKAEDLSKRWVLREGDAVKQVTEHLASRGESVENFAVRTFNNPQHLRTFERLAFLITNAEKRRNAALHEIERHRVADALRRASDEAVEGEFEEVAPDPLALKDAA